MNKNDIIGWCLIITIAAAIILSIALAVIDLKENVVSNSNNSTTSAYIVGVTYEEMLVQYDSNRYLRRVPVSYVKVTVNGDIFYSDENGVFIISIEDGTYVLTFEKDGYYTKTVTISVSVLEYVQVKMEEVVSLKGGE